MPQHFYLTFDEARDEATFAIYATACPPALMHLPPPPWITPPDDIVEALMFEGAILTRLVLERMRRPPKSKAAP